MGMIAVYQQVTPATLSRLLSKPALLEDFLFPDQDSYGVDGYGNLEVDVSKTGMCSWEEIHRRVQGLGGEAKLKGHTSVPLKSLEITRDTIRWREPGRAELQQRPHAAVAELRLVPPLRQRLVRVRHRVGEFAAGVVMVAVLLSAGYLRYQQTHGLPGWGLAALLLAFSGLVVLRSALAFAHERIVVVYRHRRSRSIARAKPEPMDIDKAWEPIEAALKGRGHGEAETALNAVRGGREIEGADLGFGPARYLDSEEVVAAASALSRISAKELADACSAELREYVALHFRNLQEHYADAAARGHAMILYFC